MNKMIQLPWLNIQIVIFKVNTSNLHNLQLKIINHKHLIILNVYYLSFGILPIPTVLISIHTIFI